MDVATPALVSDADAAVTAAGGAALVTFERVTLGYGRRTVLSDLSFTLNAGDFVGIVGPNGAGKTTLLRAILGLIRPQKGAVVPHKRPLRFGYVPQAQTMNEQFPLTALDIVLMGRYRGLGLLRRPGRSDREQAGEALAQVGLGDAARSLFRDLSGGQKQRVLVARALLSEPDALVLDEPTTGMDVGAEHTTMELVDRLHAERPEMLVLMVSHALNVVANHARQVAILGSGRFTMGPVGEVVRAETLRALYGIPLEVTESGGRRMVL
jgi:ABC-type Mn2+/Zn2+ transport system ATPase subunit